MDDPLTEAQRVALKGLAARGGRMVVTLELDGGSEALSNSAAALCCLQRCVEAGYATHTKIAEASGLFELTPLGRFRYELDASK
jgi:hypothetical protein